MALLSTGKISIDIQNGTAHFRAFPPNDASSYRPTYKEKLGLVVYTLRKKYSNSR